MESNIPCWGCKHANIYEDGYEWLECYCELHSKKTNFHGCENYEKKEEKDQ